MPFVTRVRRDRWDRDPMFLKNRAIIRARRGPCARCGGEIDYAAPYWWIVDGKRRVNPRAFHCGHILARVNGGGHELSNLQAEHAVCSIRAGAREANRRRRAAAQAVVWSERPATSSRW
jgi:hypothetical protein